MSKTIKKLRIIWLSLLGLALIFLLFKSIVPFGKITYQTDFKNYSYVFDEFLPAQRVTQNTFGKKIIDEPVYLSLYSPRRFDKAVVTLVFSDPPEIFNFGVAYNKALWAYDFKTVYNKNLSQDKQLSKKINDSDYEARLEFDLTKAERLKNRYTFMFSMPDLDKSNNRLIIKNIKVELSGSNLWQLVSRLFGKV